jgi:hypothetical protein
MDGLDTECGTAAMASENPFGSTEAPKAGSSLASRLSLKRTNTSSVSSLVDGLKVHPSAYLSPPLASAYISLTNIERAWLPSRAVQCYARQVCCLAAV